MPNIPSAPLNPLALTALHLLHERAMHPYEMARVIKERRIDVVLALKRGSLYHAIERLERHGLIEAVETSREGRRPERTVYRLTDAGRDEFEARLRDLLADARYAPTDLTAGLQFITSLSPADARRQLESRRTQLRALIASFDAVVAADWPGKTRVQVLEAEHARALAAAELAWVEGVLGDLKAGRLRWDPDRPHAESPELRVVDGRDAG